MECKAVSGTLLHILALNINGYGFGILISLWFMITRQDIETPHLCRMDAEEDLDDLVGVICTGHVLEGAHILNLTQLPTFAAHGPGSRDGN